MAVCIILMQRPGVILLFEKKQLSKFCKKIVQYVARNYILFFHNGAADVLVGVPESVGVIVAAVAAAGGWGRE